jgi:hypothetical protein
MSLQIGEIFHNYSRILIGSSITILKSDLKKDGKGIFSKKTYVYKKKGFY